MGNSDESDQLALRVDAVKTLLGLFKVERIVYISVIVVSLVFLLISAVKVSSQSGFDGATVIGVFGPTGVITVTTGRLLKMWNDAMSLVQGKELS